MGKYISAKNFVEASTPVRRFYSDKKKAIEGAQLLYTKLQNKEAVFIFCIMYGIFENKKAEYSVRLYSEGVRTDSKAIIYRYEPAKEIKNS